MNFKRIVFKILLFILFIPSQTTTAQQDSTATKLSRFVKHINTFNKLYPQEKVYLQFDNTGYYLGETIWFKAYVVRADEHLPTNLSRVLYVELLNPEGDIVETKKLKVENGQCHGDFQLKDSLFAGYYELRAYTRYMLNFGNTEFTAFHHSDSKNASEYKAKQRYTYDDFRLYPYGYCKNTDRRPPKDYYDGYNAYQEMDLYLLDRPVSENECTFSRVFPVYNRPATPGEYFPKAMRLQPRIEELAKPKKKIQEEKPFNVSFYPEGGNLITGLSSRVSFKAVSGQGVNIPVKGVIKNSQGETVASLEAVHDGMGSFEFTPDGKPYIAEVYYKEYISKFDVVQSEPAGYVMRVNAMHPDRLTIEIQKNDPISKKLGLTISCRGKIAYADTLQVKPEEPCLLVIPKEVLSTGVNQITLFDANGKVLADRLAFVNHMEYNQVSLKVTGQKGLYKPYEPVCLNFQLTDSLHALPDCSFSLAVRDAQTEDFTYPADNVLTNLLLSSDLKGYIVNPGYYFESNDNAHRYALDLLMLTQGWRRYAWKEMAGIDTFKIKQPLEKGLAIEGTLRQTLREKRYTVFEMSNDPLSIASNTSFDLELILPDKTILDGQCQTDSVGRFNQSVSDFQGVGELIPKFEWNKDHLREYILSLNTYFSPIPKTYSFYHTGIPYSTMGNENDSPGKRSSINTISIKEVTVSAKRKKRQAIDLAHPNFRLSYEEARRSFQDLLYRSTITGHDIVVDGKRTYSISENDVFAHVLVSRGLGNARVRWLISENEDDSIFSWFGSKEYGYNYSSENSTRMDCADSMYIYTDLASRRRYAASEEKLSQSKLPLILILTKHYSVDVDTIKPKLSITPFSTAFEINGPGRHIGKKYEPGKDLYSRKLQGYSYVSEFYSPDYKNNALPDKKDFRRTLYWNPDVKTDSNGKAQVSFYNNSTCKRINIRAETVTSDGVPVVYTPPIP